MLFILCILAALVPPLVWAETRDRRPARYIIKPMASALLLGLAWTALGPSGEITRYSGAILTGLALSFAGDCAMMFQERRAPFLSGLGAFLLAHICYCVAFISPELASTSGGTTLLAASVISAGFYLYLHPGLGPMRLPVVGYVLVITVMLAAAVHTLWTPNISTQRAWLVAVGALLFYASDLILAIDKFRRPFRWNRFGLIPYFAGQATIAMSLAY